MSCACSCPEHIRYNVALHLFFNKKCAALVRGYLAEKIFHKGYITEKRLRTTVLQCVA